MEVLRCCPLSTLFDWLEVVVAAVVVAALVGRAGGRRTAEPHRVSQLWLPFLSVDQNDVCI